MTEVMRSETTVQRGGEQVSKKGHLLLCEPGAQRIWGTGKGSGSKWDFLRNVVS